MITRFQDVIDFLIRDWVSHPTRFVLETLGFLGNLAAAILLMVTSPTPPMHWVYPLWLSAAVCLLYAAWTRGSSALVTLFGLYLIIDSIGFYKAL
jgi:hypothetical protein